jgi:hypothetical protein
MVVDNPKKNKDYGRLSEIRSLTARPPRGLVSSANSP